jgi:ABC-type transporter MlaC component
MNRRSFLRRAGLAALVSLALAAGAPEAKASADGARDFIQQLGRQAVSTLSDPQPTREALQRLIDTGLDVESVGRFALGAFLRQSSPEKVRIYLGVFRDYVLMSYPDLLAKLKLREIEVLAVKPVDDQTSAVATRIGHGERDTVEVVWAVREVQPGQYKIQDVQVSGHSLRAFQRAKFEKILRERWIDGLIKVMETWVQNGREDPVL